MTTRKRDRFFAGFGAVLFLLSASAITIVAVASSHNTDSSQTADQSKSTTCDSSASISSAALPLPEAFKPDGSVKTLQTTDLEAGSGPALKSGDCVQVKYFGSLAKDGTVFDENFDKPTGFQFQLGQGQVIQGWDQGLVGAKIGTTRRLVIPSSLGYGNQAAGSIPANSDLVFVVKILGVSK